VIDALTTLAFDYPKRSAYFPASWSTTWFSREQKNRPLG